MNYQTQELRVGISGKPNKKKRKKNRYFHRKMNSEAEAEDMYEALEDKFNKIKRDE